MEALVAVAQGLRPKEVAQRMKCSEPTAYCHLTHACRKTGSSHYQELMAKLLAFACQTAGHTPPDHRAFVDSLQTPKSVRAGRQSIGRGETHRAS
jgi:DNA-binding CsgD family transcriptional regulator